MPSSARRLRTWIVSGCIACASFGARDAAAAGVDPASATPAQKSEAQKRFDRGRELSAAQRFPEALVEFQASYEIVASPNTHFSIARTLGNLGQLGEAYVEFGKTLSEAQADAAKDKRYAQAAEAADAEQRDLRGKIAFLVVSVDHGQDATVKIGDREIDRLTLSSGVPVTPGTTNVVVSISGAEVARQVATVSAGDRKTIALDARPKPADPGAPLADTTIREQTTVTVNGSASGLRTAAYVAGSPSSARWRRARTTSCRMLATAGPVRPRRQTTSRPDDRGKPLRTSGSWRASSARRPEPCCSS